MNLVIVESPAKAKTINKYLGDNYKVLASYGHIRDLPSKNGSVDPDHDFKMEWEVDSFSKKYLKEITDAAKDSSKIILATDPDREGEAIAWHVKEYLNEKKLLKDKEIERVVFNEITKKAVLHGIDNPRQIEPLLVDAYMARRALDYLVGFNISPILWTKLPGSKSAGRVQSVALKLITEREHEIESFNPEEFWTLSVKFKDKNNQIITASISQLENNKIEKFSFRNKEEINKAISIINKKKFSITDISSKIINRNPSGPFTTSTLQQTASSKLGFGASRTMQIAQKLYQGIEIEGETIGLITYMRTDGTNLSKDAVSAFRDYIKKEIGNEYLPESSLNYSGKKAKNAQEAHEAIRPTSISKTPDSIKSFLDDDQFKLYDLIWKRTVASQMTESINKKTTIITSSENEKYKFKSDYDELTFDGYKKLFPEKESESMPPVSESDIVDLDKLNKEQKFTQHPPRYSEASLIKTLEDLGIGRPSTYASILNTIKDKKYVWVINRSIYLSPIGKVLVEEIKKDFSNEFMDYKFTEKMENDLDSISNGTLKRSEFIKSFWQNFEPVRNNYEKRSEENPRNPSEYNFIKTNIICSSKSPCVNSETGKEFQENDQPLGTKSLNSSLEKLPRMVWIRFRNNKGDGAFLACEDRECKVTADESAWAGFGRRRTRTMEALKISMKEKSIH